MILERIPTVSGTAGEKGKSITERAAGFVIGLCLIFVILITSAQAVCFWIPGWWRAEYSKHNTTSYVTGEMSLDDAVHVTEDMLEYCIGRLDTLDDTEATIDGVTAPFFTDREKAHLADCRELFGAAIRARALALLLAVGLAVYLYTHKGKKGLAQTCARGYLLSLAFVMALAVIIAILAAVNFNYVFTVFHHIFFDNDLWILYPDRDNLVNIMQESVFADAALWIACIWAAVNAALAAASALVLKRN